MKSLPIEKEAYEHMAQISASKNYRQALLKLLQLKILLKHSMLLSTDHQTMKKWKMMNYLNIWNIVDEKHFYHGAPTIFSLIKIHFLS